MLDDNDLAESVLSDWALDDVLEDPEEAPEAHGTHEAASGDATAPAAPAAGENSLGLDTGAEDTMPTAPVPQPQPQPAPSQDTETENLVNLDSEDDAPQTTYGAESQAPPGAFAQAEDSASSDYLSVDLQHDAEEDMTRADGATEELPSQHQEPHVSEPTEEHPSDDINRADPPVPEHEHEDTNANAGAGEGEAQGELVDRADNPNPPGAFRAEPDDDDLDETTQPGDPEHKSTSTGRTEEHEQEDREQKERDKTVEPAPVSSVPSEETKPPAESVPASGEPSGKTVTDEQQPTPPAETGQPANQTSPEIPVPAGGENSGEIVTDEQQSSPLTSHVETDQPANQTPEQTPEQATATRPSQDGPERPSQASVPMTSQAEVEEHQEPAQPGVESQRTAPTLKSDGVNSDRSGANEDAGAEEETKPSASTVPPSSPIQDGTPLPNVPGESSKDVSAVPSQPPQPSAPSDRTEGVSSVVGERTQETRSQEEEQQLPADKPSSQSSEDAPKTQALFPPASTTGDQPSGKDDSSLRGKTLQTVPSSTPVSTSAPQLETPVKKTKAQKEKEKKERQKARKALKLQPKVSTEGTEGTETNREEDDDAVQGKEREEEDTQGDQQREEQEAEGRRRREEQETEQCKRLQESEERGRQPREDEERERHQEVQGREQQQYALQGGEGQQLHERLDERTPPQQTQVAQGSLAVGVVQPTTNDTDATAEGKTDRKTGHRNEQHQSAPSEPCDPTPSAQQQRSREPVNSPDHPATSTSDGTPRSFHTTPAPTSQREKPVPAPWPLPPRRHNDVRKTASTQSTAFGPTPQRTSAGDNRSHSAFGAHASSPVASLSSPPPSIGFGWVNAKSYLSHGLNSFMQGSSSTSTTRDSSQEREPAGPRGNGYPAQTSDQNAWQADRHHSLHQTTSRPLLTVDTTRQSASPGAANGGVEAPLGDSSVQERMSSAMSESVLQPNCSDPPSHEHGPSDVSDGAPKASGGSHEGRFGTTHDNEGAGDEDKPAADADDDDWAVVGSGDSRITPVSASRGGRRPIRSRQTSGDGDVSNVVSPVDPLGNLTEVSLYELCTRRLL